MFCSIEKAHESFFERRFRVVYFEATSSSKELLKKDNSASLHYRKIQFLDTEMLRVYKWIFTKIMAEIFPQMELLNYKKANNLIFQQDQLKVCMIVQNQ